MPAAKKQAAKKQAAKKGGGLFTPLMKESDKIRNLDAMCNRAWTRAFDVVMKDADTYELTETQIMHGVRQLLADAGCDADEIPIPPKYAASRHFRIDNFPSAAAGIGRS